MSAALHYHLGWDVARIGPIGVRITDEVSTFQVRLFEGTFCNLALSSVVTGYVAFAAALAAAINAAKTGAGTFSVTYSESTGYTIAYTNDANWQLTFSAATTPAEGERLRKILGFTGDRTGGASYASTVRPLYQIIPAIEGRSSVEDEYEPDGVADESVSDDGEESIIAKDPAEVWLDWTQSAEINEPHTDPFGPGTPMHIRFESAQVPLSYQRAWRHLREGNQPFAVSQGQVSVHTLRAAGMTFHPTRFAAPDTPLFSQRFMTRLKGYVS